jgi:hypothetical protein
MSTKKTEKTASVVVNPVVANEKTASDSGRVSISTADYIKTATRKGNPLLVGNEKTRLYANGRVNGTTLILLGALSGGYTGKSVIGLEGYRTGIAALKANNFSNPLWKRLEANWKRGENRSASPALKIGPVLSALAREVSKGAIDGFDLSGIGDLETRKIFGFNF